MAAIAARRFGNTTRPVEACLASGTVRNTAEATKPSVPSEPISRWARICAGESWSSRLFSP
jgi:hypothetical protein